ncbi:MAG: thioredoxin, partial [Candidatus Bathyarchaeia archaeon]
KDSYQVAEYLKSKGYDIIPINPFADEILGGKCYRSLLDMPEDLQKKIGIVDIFRPSQDVTPIVTQAIELRKKHGKPDVIWMQLGIVNEEAAKRAAATGFTVVMDKCMKIEHGRLSASAGEDPELERIRAKKMRELMEKASGETTEQKDILSAPITVSDDSFDQAVQQYPLMVIDCWAAWCGPCRMIAPIIDELAKDYSGKVVFGKLNVDENPKTAMRFGVMSIPTLLIMKNGKEIDRIIGAVPKQSIEARLRKHM